MSLKFEFYCITTAVTVEMLMSSPECGLSPFTSSLCSPTGGVNFIGSPVYPANVSSM